MSPFVSKSNVAGATATSLRIRFSRSATGNGLASVGGIKRRGSLRADGDLVRPKAVDKARIRSALREDGIAVGRVTTSCATDSAATVGVAVAAAVGKAAAGAGP